MKTKTQPFYRLSDLARDLACNQQVLRTILIEAGLPFEVVGVCFLIDATARAELIRRYDERHARYDKPRRPRPAAVGSPPARTC